jgi:hypothetical protein
VAAVNPGTMALCPSSPRYDEGDEDCETGADWSLPLAFNAEGDVLRSGESLAAGGAIAYQRPCCSPRPHYVAGSNLSSIFRRS